MVAKLEADDGADVEIRHELIAGLNRFFHLNVVRQQQRLEGAEIVGLERSPHPDLLDKDEVRLGVDVFGGCDLLRGGRGEARGEQSEEEDWRHGWESNLNVLDCILHFWRWDMRALPWIIAGVGIGMGVTILLFNESEPDYATGYDGVESAARKTFGWGTKKRAEG